MWGITLHVWRKMVTGLGEVVGEVGMESSGRAGRELQV